MNYQECKKEFIKTANNIAPRMGRWDIVSDFATLARCAIINNSTPFRSDDYEKEYMRIIGKYEKDEAKGFSHMLALVYMAQSDNDGDFLGECLMEMEMGNKDMGQFFTPYSVCQAMAKMTLGDVSENAKRKGYLSFSEPAAGGGAMIIASANELKTLHPGVECFAVCTELSSLTADLCYINLTASQIPAQVINGNTLSMEVFRTMPTPQLCTNVWSHRLSFPCSDEPAKTIHLTPSEGGEKVDTGFTSMGDVATILGEEPWLKCSERLHVFSQYVATDY